MFAPRWHVRAGTIRSVSGRVASRCHTRIGSCPVARASAAQTSRSRLEPGKMTTAALIGLSPMLLRRRYVDRVVLDHRIGEQFLAHRLDLFAGADRISFRKIELDQLALAHLSNPRESKTCERIADRLTLRVQHARLQHYVNPRFH